MYIYCVGNHLDSMFGRIWASTLSALSSRRYTCSRELPMRRSSEFRFVDLFYLFVKVHHLRVDHAPYSCLSRFNAVESWWKSPNVSQKGRNWRYGRLVEFYYDSTSSDIYPSTDLSNLRLNIVRVPSALLIIKCSIRTTCHSPSETIAITVYKLRRTWGEFISNVFS